MSALSADQQVFINSYRAQAFQIWVRLSPPHHTTITDHILRAMGPRKKVNFPLRIAVRQLLRFHFSSHPNLNHVQNPRTDQKTSYESIWKWHCLFPTLY